MKVKIERVTKSTLNKTFDYLNQHEETSQFLIGNLKLFGPDLIDHQYSGNFKMLVSNNKIEGVFYLNKVGTLIAQASKDHARLIFESCKEEDVLIKGFIGSRDIISEIYEYYRKENPQFNPGYKSKEILYKYILKRNDSTLCYDDRVKLLTNNDFEKWYPLHLDYMQELKLPETGTKEEVRKNFQIGAREKIRWGLFKDNQLIAIAALNSTSEKTGQVGGVFTKSKLRQKGYGKAICLHMLKDCIEIHGHTKNILFTGEEDIPAQKLYESIGYERIGFFALIFS